MAFEVSWEARGIYKKFSDHVSDDELIRSVSGVYGDPRFDDLRYAINDFLSVESYSITEDAVMYVAAMDGAAARSNPDIRVAIVVSESHERALAQLYASSPWTAYPTRIFLNVAEARTWAMDEDQPDSKP